MSLGFISGSNARRHDAEARQGRGYHERRGWRLPVFTLIVSTAGHKPQSAAQDVLSGTRNARAHSGHNQWPDEGNNRGGEPVAAPIQVPRGFRFLSRFVC